jgi:hypothetical protein
MPARLQPARLLRASLRESRPGFIAVGGLAAGEANYASQITVGKPGRCGHQPALVMAAFDNSGSITGGADPVGQRFVENYVAAERVGRRCKCGRDLMAIYHFDTPTSRDLEPTPLRNLKAIRDSLEIPPDGAGASAMLASLRAARRQAERHPDHLAMFVPFTDFALFDDYLSELLDFPGQVHAVSLGGTIPTELIETPGVTVTRVTDGSRPGAVARALFAALTATRDGAEPLPAAELTEHAEVGP